MILPFYLRNQPQHEDQVHGVRSKPRTKKPCAQIGILEGYRNCTVSADTDAVDVEDKPRLWSASVRTLRTKWVRDLRARRVPAWVVTLVTFFTTFRRP